MAPMANNFGPLNAKGFEGALRYSVPALVVRYRYTVVRLPRLSEFYM